jgi:hypothetical protein
MGVCKKLCRFGFPAAMRLTRRLIDGFLQVWIPYGHVNAHSAMTNEASMISNTKSGFIYTSNKFYHILQCYVEILLSVLILYCIKLK